MSEFNKKVAERDFEYWSKLYKRDSAEFEKEAKKRIYYMIKKANPRHHLRLYGLQFEIDMKLRRYKDPLVRMNKMVELFWEGVSKFEETLRGQSSKNTRNKTAEVIKFSLRKDK